MLFCQRSFSGGFGLFRRVDFDDFVDFAKFTDFSIFLTLSILQILSILLIFKIFRVLSKFVSFRSLPCVYVLFRVTSDLLLYNPFGL